MAKIPLWMDLVAGFLLALDLFQNWGILNKFYNKVKSFIKEMDTENFTNFKTMIFSGALSIFIFLMLLLWVYYSNSSNLNYDVLVEMGWFFLGVVIAWSLMTIIAKLLKRIGVFGIFCVGLVLSIGTILFFLLKPSSEIGAMLASIIYICFLYPFGMIIAGYVQRILIADEKKPFYMFAIIGIVLFIVSKIFEIAK